MTKKNDNKIKWQKNQMTKKLNKKMKWQKIQMKKKNIIL
jgi:hypothetical protein